jgi:hypothetical protein
MKKETNKMAKIIELAMEPILLEELTSLVKRFGGTGGIIIIDTPSRNKIAQYNLTEQKIRENLCLAIYYNEKIAIDSSPE